MDDLAALRLQIEWGADEALQDQPIDRTAPAAAPPPAPFARLPAAAPGPGPSAAPDLTALHDALDAFDGCSLRHTASRTVRPSGNPGAGLVLVGEAPGAEDDRSGQAYGGVAGQALDRVLGSAGLGRDAMLLCFLVPWRPPGGRQPNDAEVAQCLPFLHRLLVLTRPRRLVLLGGGPLRALGGGDRSPRGRWTEVAIPGLDAPIPALPMLSADLWLGSPGSKQATWAALLALRSAIDSP